MKFATKRLITLIRERIQGTETGPAEFARKCNVPVHTVRALLRGHEPSVDAADRLCRGLGAALRLGGEAETAWRNEQTWLRNPEARSGYKPASARLAKLAREHVRKHNLKVRVRAREASIPESRIRNLMGAEIPGLDSADTACRALGLVTSIGSPSARRALARKHGTGPGDPPRAPADDAPAAETGAVEPEFAGQQR